MSERQGIEIDYCPRCRGVWLDRGELDKIIERAPGGASAAPTSGVPAGWTQPTAQVVPAQSPGRDSRGHDTRHHPDYDYHRGKPRKHWLSELFD
jgi:Zn-finger nucleic acid-binding protein